MEKKENKTMKKGLTIAALALLLGIVGYTGGNTFAKYISETEVPTTSATVAKWGYVVNTDASKLWGADYKFDTNASVVTKDTSSLTVSDFADGSVVAPGTKGSVNLFIKGQAEVLSKLTIESDITDIFLDDETQGDQYYPVKWSLSDDSVAKINNVDQLPAEKTDLTGAQMATLLEGLSETNIQPNYLVEYNLTIEWKWDFSGTETLKVKNLYTVEDDVLTVDQADTILGNNGESYNDSSEDPEPKYTGNTMISTQTSLYLKATIQQLEQAETVQP